MANVVTNYKYTFGNARISRFWSSNPNFQAVSKQAFLKKVVFGSALNEGEEKTLEEKEDTFTLPDNARQAGYDKLLELRDQAVADCSSLK